MKSVTSIQYHPEATSPFYQIQATEECTENICFYIIFAHIYVTDLYFSSHELRQNSKFAYEEIREVHKRRYLLQPIALEVFSGDGRNFLLSFPRKVRNKVYQRLMSVATSISDNAQQSVAGQSRSANVEQSSGIFSSLIGETSVTQRWVVSFRRT